MTNNELLNFAKNNLSGYNFHYCDIIRGAMSTPAIAYINSQDKNDYITLTELNNLRGLK